jgi:hypothetical protein
MEPSLDPVDQEPNQSNLNQESKEPAIKLGISKTYSNNSYPFVVIGVVIIGFGFIVGTFIRLISMVNIQPSSQPNLSGQPTPSPEGNPPINSPNSPIKPEISSTNDVITLAKFNQVQNGMAIQQVQELIGSEGKLLGSTNAGNISGKVYSWQNPQGSNAIVEFKNDQVVSKSQAGLK